MGHKWANFINYLTHEQVTVLDTIIIALVTSALTFIFASVFKAIGNLFKKAILALYGNVRNRYAKFHRIYFKRRLSITEILIINKTLEDGGKVKWYEKKAYELYRVKAERSTGAGLAEDALEKIKEMNDITRTKL
ncbi:hypothetical protein [Priestia megaterium]